jgi:hypothetical protein
MLHGEYPAALASAELANVIRLLDLIRFAALQVG